MELLAQTCRGLCTRFKPTINSDSIRLRYKLGQKYCSQCALFFHTEEFTCPCCKTKLRSKSKSKKHNIVHHSNCIP